MPTDNPKVSAYVPKIVKDRLAQFREERDISESQAVTIILAEYFGLAEVLTRTSQGLFAGGVTLAKIENLEEKLASLEGLVESRLEALEKVVQRLSELLVVQDLLSDTSQSTGVLRNESPIEIQSQLVQPVEEKTDVFVSLLGKPLDEIKPIPGVKLSKLRFGLPEAAIAGAKRKKPLEEFTQWTRHKDPDHIAWKYVESPSKGYLPVEDLSNELRAKLLQWIRENLQE